VFDPNPVLSWWWEQQQLHVQYGVTSAEVQALDLDELFQSEAGPIGAVISKHQHDISRYPQPAPEDMQRGLWSTLWCAWSDGEAECAALEVASRQASQPHAKSAIWCAAEVKCPVLPDFKAVRMRSNQGTLLVSRKHVQLPALAPDAWPNPPGEEEVSAAEAERRKQAKYSPVDLNEVRFKEFGFSEEVVNIIKEVSVLYLGDRDKFEQIKQYPLNEADGTLAAVVKEVERAIACAAIAPPPPGVSISKVHSFVAVFKGGKTRVCLDLSVALNDCVPSIPFNLPQFDSIGEFVSCKRPTYLAKYDLRDFFWNLKVAEADQGLFGLVHPGTGELMVHSRLPFGYKDSPRIACMVSEAVAEYLRALGVNCKVFVDDFAIAADDDTEEGAYVACLEAMLICEAVFEDLGFQWAPHKKEGPVKIMTFLGVEIDVRLDKLCYRLPSSKMVKIKNIFTLFGQWKLNQVKEVPARELAEAVGMLNFASRVIPGSTLFLRRMWDMLSVAHVDAKGRPWVKWGAKPVPVTMDFWDDVSWWEQFICSRNAWRIQCKDDPPPPTLHIASDASTVGGGARLELLHHPEEVAVDWTPWEKTYHINWLELYMLWWSMACWVKLVEGGKVLFLVDNIVTMWAVRRGSSRSPVLMELVRRVWLLCILHGVVLEVEHIAGVDNVRPDALSRGAKPVSPGLRLKRQWFEWCLGVHGWPTFDVVIGLECEYLGLRESPADVSIDGVRSFLHPRFDCVASCLWWIFEALARQPFTTKGVVLLPANKEAVWWPLVSKLQVLGKLAGSTAPLSCLRMHEWSDVACKHDVLVCSFPMVVTAPVAPVKVECVTPARLASARAAGNRDSVEFTVLGSWLYKVFDAGEYRDFANLSSTKTKMWQYGWLYQVADMHTNSQGVRVFSLRFWSKSLPWGGHESRRHKFELTNESTRPDGTLYALEEQDAAAWLDVSAMVDTSSMANKKAAVYFKADAVYDECCTVWANTEALCVVCNEPMMCHGGSHQQMCSMCVQCVTEGNVSMSDQSWAAAAAEADNVSLTSTATLEHNWVLPDQESVSNSSDVAGSSNTEVASPLLVRPEMYTPSTPGTNNRASMGIQDQPAAQQRMPVLPSSLSQNVPARALRFEAKYGPARMSAVVDCWKGVCSLQGSTPTDIECPQCHKQAHSRCLQLDPQIVHLLSFGKCPDCNARDVLGCGIEDVSDVLSADFHKLSISAMGESVSVQKSAGFKNMLAAVQRYESSRSINEHQLSLQSPQLFAMVLWFVGHEEAHPASMDKHVTALTSHLLTLQASGAGPELWCKGTCIEGKMAPWSQSALVQDRLSELKRELHFVSQKGDPVPWPVVEAVSAKLASPVERMWEGIRYRTGFLNEADPLGGFRMTELSDSGSSHGMNAPDIYITAEDAQEWALAGSLSDIGLHDTQTEIYSKINVDQMHAVHFGMEDYKLHEEEALVSVASPTQSGRNVVSRLLAYCRFAGMQLRGAQTCLGKPAASINYYVLRVELMAAPESAAGARLRAAMEAMIVYLQLPAAAARWTSSRWQALWAAPNRKKRFFNIFGGTKQDMLHMLEQLKLRVYVGWKQSAELEAMRMGIATSCTVLEAWWRELDLKIKGGPLVRATHGKWFTHMPLSYSQAAKDLTTQWKAEEAKLYGENSLRLVTHSARRAATYRARVRVLVSGLPVALIDELIDRHFRWKPDTGANRKSYTGHHNLEQFRLCVTLYM
jgi:hypothetical protein